MKKRLIGGLALAAAFVSAAVLSACGGGGGNNGGKDDDEVKFDYAAPAYGSDADVTISVEAEKMSGNAGKISDTLFGVFLEDINYASYYLDDNLLKNGSFEALTAAKDTAWSALSNTTKTLKTDGQTNGVLAGIAEYTGKKVNNNYLQVTVGSAGAGGLSTKGYETAMPMSVFTGTDYKFSAFIKNPNAAFTMTVTVKDSSGIYLEGSFTVEQADEWVKYERTFTATGTKSGNLVQCDVGAEAGADFYIDGIALETLDADPVTGIKSTPYNAIKDLAPKFIRFPGGCIIEGNYGAWGDDCAYDWKNSIGAVQNGNNAGDDIVPAFTYKVNAEGTTSTKTTYGEGITRTPNPDLWAGANYYDMTYGIGFYEYFLLCDSLGASAVPVLNCGYSCMGGAATNAHALAGRHGQGVQDYIQDAIDLIEFAKGDTNTKWGKIRSDMGHPAPFEMNYIGIGNEQWGVYFTSYYEKFLENQDFIDALKKYDVKPIVGNGTQLTDCERPDNNGNLQGGLAKGYAQNYLKKTGSAAEARLIDTVSEYGVVDQHYYVNYTTLLENTHMYDNYVRPEDDEENYYEVFVGEYSANEANPVAGWDTYGNNQWICALSEAAMMTGFERNGDIVKLAAYAPMFGTARDIGGTGMAGNQWATDMMYFTGTDLVLSTNYYVQQLFMKNQGAYRINDGLIDVVWHNDLEPTFTLKADKASSTATKTINKLFYVASIAENGDLIVKIVNVSGETMKADLEISALNLKGNASVTVLQNDDRSIKNTLLEPDNIYPNSYVLGNFSGNTLGYEIKPYSVTSITIHAK